MNRRTIRGLLVALVATATIAVALPSAGADVSAQAVNGMNAVSGFGTVASSAPGVPNPPYPGGRLAAIAANPTGPGYWLAGADGAVYAYLGAPDLGSWRLISAPIVGIAANPSGPGYWTVGADGAVYALGGAPNLGGWPLISAPIVGIAANPSGPGYWTIGADGAVYALGGAPVLGDARGVFGLSQTVAIVANPAGSGFWAVSDNGAIVARGAAAIPSRAGAYRVTSAAATNDGGGMWLLTTSGAVLSSGSAPSLGGATPPPWAVGSSIAAAPSGPGYWTLMSPPAPPPRPPDNGPRPPANSGSGRRIVYANRAQQVWIMNGDDSVEASFRVSGRLGVPNPGTYRVYTRTTGRAGDLRLDFFVGFAYGAGGGNIGFHRIPVRPDGSEIQTVGQLGTPLSHGCVREAYADAQHLFNWSRLGDAVVVVP